MNRIIPHNKHAINIRTLFTIFAENVLCATVTVLPCQTEVVIPPNRDGATS
jgi:hypothetical protein